MNTNHSWRKGIRLQYILVVGFVVTAVVAIAVGTPITYTAINNYLKDAQDRRVGRDMDLAEAFYNNKLTDISASARRIASARTVLHNLDAAAHGDLQAVEVLVDQIDNEILNLAVHTQRFIVITDAQGTAIVGRMRRDSEYVQAATGADWSSLSIVEDGLTSGTFRGSTEVVPAANLEAVGLAEQARIELLPTEKAAPEPFDPLEGTAGLVLMGVSPILGSEGEVIGTVLSGHLFNRDFTLVDRIKEVAGVDTATIFFGDLRVSTNVPLDEAGNRAIGTRVSQEVFDKVLLLGQEFTGEAFVVNQNYITRYRPLMNHRQEVVGILYVGADQASFQRLLDSFRSQVFLISGATMLLAVFIAIPVAWSISRPLTSLATATRRVARGDRSVRLPVEGYAEMQSLAETFNRMVETLQDTQEQLVQKEKLASVGQLAAGVAHEINNPLGSVLLYADILRKETPEDDAQQKEDLDMIIREATRCKTIVNDLLNFSRQNEVMAQETDLNELLEELAAELGKQEFYEQVNIVSKLDPGLPNIQADPLQLRQVFVNLMNNAAEAMPGGGRLTLRTRKGPSAGFVTVDVEDTGIGISEENMKKIFTPFFTTKPIGKGTGLGLAIIYGIVKMHRGQIGVQSEPGQGTRFTITLREQLPTQPLAADTGILLE
ncbi:MAG: cache domain-containing protein [Anaerolineae bacterium]